MFAFCAIESCKSAVANQKFLHLLCQALTGRGKSNVFLLAVLLKAYVKARKTNKACKGTALFKMHQLQQLAPVCIAWIQVGDLVGAENCIKKADEVLSVVTVCDSGERDWDPLGL